MISHEDATPSELRPDETSHPFREDPMLGEGGNRLPIAIVIPCYKVRAHISSVLSGLTDRALRIYVVDDFCPEHTGDFVQTECAHPRVTVLFHSVNLGVGGAVITGYRQALEDDFDIIVKMDGDGQMDPAYLSVLVESLRLGEADYAKGNRFFDLYSLSTMPTTRLIGNAGLSFVSKLASGYWDIMDPTNGYTAIHRVALAHLPLDRLERRYFFESDMLFRLSTIRAVVRDVPMPAIYGEEVSNLNIGKVLMDFPKRFAVRIWKRFFYMYLMRDFNIGSVETITGVVLLLFGITFGSWHWVSSSSSGQVASTGTVMIAVLPIVIGVQLLLSAINYDISNRPSTPLQRVSTVRRGLDHAAALKAPNNGH
jgi:glycosyltransferase involved in cell wall biosynthesis